MTRERRSIRSIIRRAVAVQTLVVIGLIGLMLGGLLLERSVAANERKDEAILLNLETLEFQVLNAETGFRGFALSHKEPFLAPYREAFPQITVLRPKLLGQIDKTDKPYIDEAFRTIADWRQNFAVPSLEDIRNGTGTKADSLIDRGEGKQRIDRVRALVSRIRANERADLKRAADKRKRISAGIIAMLLLALAAALAGGSRAAYVLRRAVVNPITRLAAATERIHAGDLGARAEVRGAKELAAVAESFNDMAVEVEQTVDGLREIDEMKTRFLSTVSHELRTPLTSISGYLQLLEQGVVGELTPEQLGYVNVAQRNGDRLASLIDDLLMLSRFDAGRVDLKSEPVDLAAQLRDLYQSMGPVAEKGESRLELEAPDELVVDGDARRLQQSFANLVSNAIKFNRKDGEVRISAVARNGNAVIEVQDQGVGIPPEELQRIGERFFRASTTADLPGTGLGLAITREIVERHGGSLEIESEVGEGSTFRISLPRKRAEELGGAV
jgi:signal transduction histidine kinase